MAGFTFRLTSLLRMRQSQRGACRAALAEAQRLEDSLRTQFDGLGRELDALRDFCRQKVSPGAVDLEPLVEAQRYGVTARARQQGIAQQRQEAAEEIERRRQAVVEADREVRILEKLRQRQAEQHEREEELRETMRLDEAASQQHLRQAHAAPPVQDDFSAGDEFNHQPARSVFPWQTTIS